MKMRTKSSSPLTQLINFYIVKIGNPACFMVSPRIACTYDITWNFISPETIDNGRYQYLLTHKP